MFGLQKSYYNIRDTYDYYKLDMNYNNYSSLIPRLYCGGLFLVQLKNTHNYQKAGPRSTMRLL
jgi:hypothetical protein